MAPMLLLYLISILAAAIAGGRGGKKAEAGQQPQVKI
jgi:hypothetical protein